MDVSESVALNVATCTIFVSELCCMSAETIKQVNDNIRKVEKKWEDTARYKIKFNDRCIPDGVNIGYLRYNVRRQEGV